MNRSHSAMMSRLTNWFGLGVLLMALAPAASFGQFPSLPPETIGNAKYEWKPQLGGYRDVSTKLVWGYSPTGTLNWSFSHTFAKTYGATRYASDFAGHADGLIAQAESYEEAAESETDPDRAQAYLELAQRYRDDAACTEAAAAVIDLYDNWRLPTPAEFQDAYSKGLFSRGTDKFNMDQNSATGLQLGYQGLYWTSEVSKNKKQATSFDIGGGTKSLLTVTSQVWLILVRDAP
jgi:hypothetical protein